MRTIREELIVFQYHYMGGMRIYRNGKKETFKSKTVDRVKNIKLLPAADQLKTGIF